MRNRLVDINSFSFRRIVTIFNVVPGLHELLGSSLPMGNLDELLNFLKCVNSSLHKNNLTIFAEDFYQIATGVPAVLPEDSTIPLLTSIKDIDFNNGLIFDGDSRIIRNL